MTVSLLNDRDERIALGRAYVYGASVLKPGEKGFWATTLSDRPASWAAERIQVQARPPSASERREDYTDFRVEEITQTASTGQYDSHKVRGRVVNTGAGTAKSLDIVVALYDESGRLAGVETSAAMFPEDGKYEIAPGGSMPFQASFLHIKQAPATPFRVEVYVAAEQGQ